MSKINIIVCLFLCSFVFSQDAYYQYVYVNLQNGKNSLKIFDKNKEILPIENNLFQINKGKQILLCISNEHYKINLKSYRTDKFIQISVIKNTDAKSFIIKERRGDLVKIYGECKSKCNEILLEFPQIIIENRKYKTSINDIFSKYIWE